MNGVTDLPPDLWVSQQTHRALRDNIQPQRVVVRGIQFLNRKELTQARLRIWSVCMWRGREAEYCISYTLLHTALLWNYILLTHNTRQLLKRQTLHTHKHKQYWPLCCIALIGAYSNYTDKSAIPSHWHLVVTWQQLLPRCEVLCAYGLSGQCSVAQVVLRQVACQQVVWRWRERRREGEGKGGREGRVRGDREVVTYGDGGRGDL